MHSSPVRFIDTVGFTFNGENLGMGCTERTVRYIMTSEYPKWPVTSDDNVHDLVGQLARAKGEAIMYPHDYATYDVAQFDSGDVPKAVEGTSVDDDELCMCCFEPIAECA